jgi:hypothetical protein
LPHKGNTCTCKIHKATQTRNGQKLPLWKRTAECPNTIYKVGARR